MSYSDDCEMRRDDYEVLRSLPGNSTCVDCGAPSPDWGSPSFGILFCFQCSGLHRGLGTHITFVRSVTMDKWTERQIQLMKVGGNNQCNEFLGKHGINVGGDTASPVSAASTRAKYDSPPAELYKQVLVARVEGRPEPTDLPPPRSSKKLESGRMQGFGSAPPPAPPRQSAAVVAAKWGAVVAVGVAVTAIAFSSGLLPH